MRTAGLKTRLDLTSAHATLEDLRSGSTRYRLRPGRRRPRRTPAVEGELASAALDLTPYLPRAAAASCPAGNRQAVPDQGLVRRADRLAAALAGGRRFPAPRRWREGAAGRARRRQLAAAGRPAAGHRHHGRGAGLWRSGHRECRATPGSPPVYAVELQSQGIGLLAAVQALTGKGRFDGKRGPPFVLAASGKSQRELVGGLGGEGKIVLRDGAILGINIASMLRQIMTLGLNPGDRAAADRLRRGRRQLQDPGRHAAQR